MFDLIFHLDDHLVSIVQVLGPWTLGALFLIVFCETGLVVTPFLPGDSLLFATGAVSALFPKELPLDRVLATLVAAAVLGDWLNSEVGRYAGGPLTKWLTRRQSGAQHMEVARLFFQKHGGKAIIFARFLPLLRTFVPFVAGLSGISRRRFALFNVVGALTWVGSLTALGHAFGNLPIIKGRFHFIILGIIFVSMAPALWEAFKAWRRQSRMPVVSDGS